MSAEGEEIEEEVYEIYEEEEIVSDSSSSDLLDILSKPSQVVDMKVVIFRNIINRIRNVTNNILSATNDSGVINFILPSNILPLAFRESYFFTDCNIASVSIKLDDYSWKKQPISPIQVENSKYGTHFIGRRLMVEIIEKFFKPDFKPRDFYKSAAYIILPLISERYTEAFNKLIIEQYDSSVVKCTLGFFDGDIDKARNAIRIGQFDKKDTNFTMPFTLEECPLLYLILEIVEIYFDFQDHCCRCGKPLNFLTVRPTTCPECDAVPNTFLDTNLLFEIQRDPYAADLLISSFANGFTFMDPMPPPMIINYLYPKNELDEVRLNAVFRDLPTATEMASRTSESDLYNLLVLRKNETNKPFYNQYQHIPYDIVHWIIYSNKNQLISLHGDLRIFKDVGKQFFILSADQEKERLFKEQLKNRASMYLFHGCPFNRVFSILHNGLRNYSGTKHEENGHVHGNGIYLASKSEQAQSYSKVIKNKYRRSCMKQFNVVFLCEVALEGLVDKDLCYMTENEAGVKIRVLMIGKEHRTQLNTKIHVPDLKEILEYRATLAVDKIYSAIEDNDDI